MEGSSMFSALNQIASQVWFSDLLIALFALFFVTSLHRFTQKGPMAWPVLGMIPAIVAHLGNIYEWATDALIDAGGHFAYRGVWFGGAYGIITVNPSHIEYMLKSRFANFPKGAYYRERFRDLLGDGIFNADGDVWKLQRRAATSAMHSPRFTDYSLHTIRHLVHAKLIPLLRRLASPEGGEKTVDMQELLLRFTFDNICTAAFGVDPGCLAPDLPEVAFAKAFEDATELTLVRFLSPPFLWKPMKYLNVGPERRLEEAVKAVHDFAAGTVSDRRKELTEAGTLISRSDLLSRLMEDGAGEAKEQFSDQFLQDFCISFILAGRDTSSVGLAWFFWLIHEHPRVQAAILDEIDGILRRREGSSDEGEVVFSAAELNEMVYLHAALSESMRLYPPVPIDFKEVVEDDVFPDGTAVRRGARVLYSIFSMARMESIWGKDCREFRPERWIGEGGRMMSESQFKYPVFNAGPRLCVGKKFAFLQMKMVVASVLVRFRVEVAKECRVGPKVTTTLYMRNGLLVTIKPR